VTLITHVRHTHKAPVMPNLNWKCLLLVTGVLVGIALPLPVLALSCGAG
jgi:hypothetical protein